MQVQPMPVNELVNDPNNARTHDERNLDAIRASLERFGQQKPIVINADNTVVAGNGTLAAAMSGSGIMSDSSSGVNPIASSSVPVRSRSTRLRCSCGAFHAASSAVLLSAIA